MKASLAVRRSLRIGALALLGAAALLAGCATSQPPATKAPAESAASAQWRTYHNDFFGFTMQVPRAWHSADSAFMQAYEAKGMKVLSGDRDDLPLAVAEQDPRAVLLVTAMRFPVGSQSKEFNDNIVCAAIKISDVAAVEDGADYLRVATGGEEQGGAKIKRMSIADRDFFLRDIVHRDRPDVTQQVVATVDRGYALTCTLTYAGGSKPQVLYRALSSIRIAK